ncbi:MAG: GrdX family protein [Oscillospiraceae bacterium]|nr:GrdX family protein [Oscillospiraceae bacterium]
MVTLRSLRIITNNLLVKEKLSFICHMEYADIPQHEILVRVRDLVYAGHTLCTHPLAGSVKPNETPYRSIAVSHRTAPLDEQSVLRCACAAEVLDRFKPFTHTQNEGVLRDLRLIDYTLLAAALGIDTPKEFLWGGRLFETGTGLYQDPQHSAFKGKPDRTGHAVCE